MLKILQILPSDTPGIQQLAEMISSSFPTNQFHCTTAYLNPCSHKQATGNIHYFNFSKNKTKGLKLRALWQLLIYCRKEKFDIIITHRFKPLHLMLILNVFLKAPICISVIHGFGDFSRLYRRLILKLFWTRKWHFIAISGPVANYLFRFGNDSYKNNVSVIENAINVHEVTSSLKSKTSSVAELKIKKTGVVFGTIGRLIPLKGHIHLIRAFEIVLKEHPNSQLLIIGEGRSRSKLENHINNHDLQNDVILAGHLDDAATYLKAFDVFVLPSEKEGFGMVLLEAMAAKVPIIASHTGGIPYVLGDLGELISPLSYPQGLATAMLDKINQGNDKRQEEGEKFYQHLTENFSEDKYKKGWLSLIKQKESEL